MENNWPETVDELLGECHRLISKNDLYTLGERGEPFSGETEPRVDGTEYLAGEYQYGVAMIPAQWVTHVIEAATMGSGECEAIYDKSYHKGIHGYCEGLKCSNCESPLFSSFYYCPWCGARIRKMVKQ
jgi:hypothetical protein